MSRVQSVATFAITVALIPLFVGTAEAAMLDHGQSTSTAERRRICENSDDLGDNKAGAKGCFKDKGDEWYACDIHKGGSGTAWVQVTEWTKRKFGKKLGGYKIEEDNASDGVKVLRDCDEGPEININKGNWIRLDICIETSGHGFHHCDQRWIAE